MFHVAALHLISQSTSILMITMMIYIIIIVVVVIIIIIIIIVIVMIIITIINDVNHIALVPATDWATSLQLRSACVH